MASFASGEVVVPEPGVGAATGRVERVSRDRGRLGAGGEWAGDRLAGERARVLGVHRREGDVLGFEL